MTIPLAVTAASVQLPQPLDPGVALLRRPAVAHGGHLVGDVGVDVSVTEARLEAVLHVVRRPQLDER